MICLGSQNPIAYLATQSKVQVLSYTSKAKVNAVFGLALKLFSMHLFIVVGKTLRSSKTV
jgi:hypothetical protein